MKRINEIVDKVLLAHEAIEDVRRVVMQAIDDGRFKMTVEDHRAFRDLLDDSSRMLNEAWRGSLQIPVEQSKQIINQSKK